MSLLSRLRTVSALAAAVALAPLAPASAQTTTMDFAGLGLGDFAAVPAGYGSHANLTVSNRTRTAFGNGPVSFCAAGSAVLFWNTGYSSLSGNVLPCLNGGVGEFQFVPLAGSTVTLQSLDLGSFLASVNGVGPTRNYDVRVYDLSWNPLFAQTGTVGATTPLAINVSSTSGLYLQFGTDWNVGVDNIVTTVTTPQSTVPEPTTFALLVPAAAGLAVVARRRRRA